MKFLSLNRRILALLAVLVPLLALLIYVALRSGSLAPIPVTVTTAESRSIATALFGIGTVEARYTYRIGPTVAGRVKRVDGRLGVWLIEDDKLRFAPVKAGDTDLRKIRKADLVRLHLSIPGSEKWRYNVMGALKAMLHWAY